MNKNKGLSIGVVSFCEETLTYIKNSITQRNPSTKLFSTGSVLKLFKEAVKKEIHFQTVILEVDFQDRDSLNNFEMLRVKMPQARIAVIANIDNIENIIRAFSMGAFGLLQRKEDLQEFDDDFFNIESKGYYLSSKIAFIVLNHLRLAKACERVNLNSLNVREMNVVRAICEGMTYEMIAKKFNLKIDTVRYRIRRIYSKLQINSSAELTSIFLRHKLGYSELIQ